MSPEQALDKLVAELETVQQRRNLGADDWRYSLLRTFREYCRTVGVKTILLSPIEEMVLDAATEISQNRLRDAGKLGAVQPIGPELSMVLAAACVTILHDRDRKSIPNAINLVAKIAKIDPKKLKSFRDNLNRCLGKPEKQSAYEAFKAEVQTWPADGISDALGAIAGYVK